ncbi:MAG: hypothetical protein NTZ87_00865 [Candidatus Nomurabacteria bacterium]|nr:hypothetical protein [Candidatus Nomurabacteria bacterium]
MQIKFFKKEKKFKKQKESLWLNINVYWKLAVGFMFLIIILSGFFGYYSFQKINKESETVSSGTDANSQIETVKKEKIDKVLEYFSQRKDKSSQILNSPAPVIDPSL